MWVKVNRVIEVATSIGMTQGTREVAEGISWSKSRASHWSWGNNWSGSSWGQLIHESILIDILRESFQSQGSEATLGGDQTSGKNWGLRLESSGSIGGDADLSISPSGGHGGKDNLEQQQISGRESGSGYDDNALLLTAKIFMMSFLADEVATKQSDEWCSAGWNHWL